MSEIKRKVLLQSHPRIWGRGTLLSSKSAACLHFNILQSCFSLQVFSKSSSELELVALYPLTVLEGGVAVITTQNIDVVLDHHKYGVRPSGVLLHLAQSPQHGRIAIDLSPQRNSPQYSNYLEGDGKMKQYFTLMNLSRDKVCLCFFTVSTHIWYYICNTFNCTMIIIE